MITRDYKTLDAILVMGSLLILAYAMWALVTRDIPQPNLPILASLVSGTAGTFLGLYAGSRWGNKKPAEDEPKAGTPGTGGVSLSLQATSDPTPAPPPQAMVES